MSDELESKYRQYKALLYQRHLDSGTWVLNWDLQRNQPADFGKGDSLFYTSILLAALALEENEEQFLALVNALNQQSFARGMYPRYTGTFDTSKDPYHTLILALLYGSIAFPQNTTVRETLSDIIQGVRDNRYSLKNPDGSPTRDGDMSGLRPVFDLVGGRSSPLYFLSMLVFPLYSFILNISRRSYFNNFMVANEYLMLECCVKNGAARWCLKQSAKLFSLVNRNNPYILMLRDLILGSDRFEQDVSRILQTFPDSHLPNEADRITNSDVLWQIDPRDWDTPNAQNTHEFSGVDYLILYQLYSRHYGNGRVVAERNSMAV